MTFLSKILGAIVKIGSVIITGFPMFSNLIPKGDQPEAQKVVGELQQFLGITQTVEVTASALSASNNTEGKIDAVSQGISQVLLSSPALTGHKIQNPDAFKQACSYYALATNALMESLHPDGVVVQAKTS